MCETATSISLYEGSTSKTFAAEVTNPLGYPLKNVQVIFALEGEGSLAGDSPLSAARGRTDETGTVVVSFNRPAGSKGRLGASLKAECPLDAAQIRLRLIAVTPDLQQTRH